MLIRRLWVLGAFAALLTAVPSVAQTDPRIGTWTLVSAEGTVDPPNRLTITAQDGGLHVVMSGERHLDFTANEKGHDSPAPGNLGFDKVALHKIDKRQAEVKEMKNGALVATVREKVSPDGKELTSTVLMAGKADQVSVWTRTGGKKAMLDPFAGEWTQDPGKSRMRENLPLRIEADGRGGERFVWDYSYTGRLDGKAYDLKDSRNDTVSLQMVDPHTVDATYKRDNQVTQKDRWVVSGDGRQMTVSSSGTLETGQKFMEKMVFKKS